jgi:hypothetical protein
METLLTPSLIAGLSLVRIGAGARSLVRWPCAFIALWLVVQLCLPLHYYLIRADEHDERFAWRMFSPLRMMRCSIEISVASQPIVITSEFHDAWEKVAQRGRRSVIAAMGQHLCRKYPGKPVVARLRCTPIQGDPYAVGGFDLCQIPEF